MRLLVTGGAGFIGSNFIRYWLNHHPDDSVVNLDALTYAGNLENLRDVENDPRYRFIHGNICDPEKVREAMEGVDIVVHFAAESHVDRSVIDSAAFLKTNVLGTQVLLEEVLRRGPQIKRFHHVSTDEVFGSLTLEDPRKFDEATPYAPRNPYSASKAASDHLCRSYFIAHRLPLTISNCSNNYGPYMFPEKLFPLCITNAMRDLPLPIYGDGKYVRDWIQVEDHCRGIEAVLERGRLGETYCLGGGNERANIDVARTILKILNKPETLLKYVEDRKGHDRRYAIDDTKARRELGWAPQYSFEDGLAHMVAWYQRHEAWWRPLLDRRGTSSHVTSNDASPKTSPMKILILGKGWIGSRMAETWPNAVISDAWITDKASVLKLLDEHKPDAVVNAAGVVGVPNVDWCETHQVETTEGNTVLPIVIAEACQEKNIYLLHLGTGCVFYGPSPDHKGWKEDDAANPSAMYTRSKYAADLVLSRLPNTAIARLRMPIDHVPSQKNLIGKLASFKSVIDVENSVTILDDLVSACYQLIQKRGTGIFHCVNPGIMRHRDLLGLYEQYVDPNHKCEWIREEDLVARGLTAKKRSNNIMQSPRLAELGISMRPIDVALRDTMVKYAQNLKAPAPVQNVPVVNTFPHFLKNRPREMKGVLLAGGKGTRLAPLTNVTNKHLLPIANRQMILYPLKTLLDIGIKNIMLITGPDHADQFITLLGSGSTMGCKLAYRIQDEAGGIAQALGMAEDFVGNDNCTAVLGDNIFEDNFQAHIAPFQSGAMAFYKPVSDPQRFGVMEIDGQGNVLSIEEKPKQPKSNFAQVGLYVYEPSVFEIIRTLKPSGRGELEITDVNNAFLSQKKLTARPVQGFWSDAGTFASLKRATDFVVSKYGLGE